MNMTLVRLLTSASLASILGVASPHSVAAVPAAAPLLRLGVCKICNTATFGTVNRTIANGSCPGTGQQCVGVDINKLISDGGCFGGGAEVCCADQNLSNTYSACTSSGCLPVGGSCSAGSCTATQQNYKGCSTGIHCVADADCSGSP